ncbi:hypothetical protein [Sclerotinia sclerotiorum deltaflexivirus 3]|nr:hypothetical protein [Sclerotinia sclerotiorum deltaflexivirus 3]
MSPNNQPSANLAPAATQSNPAFNTDIGPSSLTLIASQHPTSVTIPLLAEMNSTAHTKTFDPRSHDGIRQMMSMFESVRLDEISFTIILTPGISRKVIWGVNTGIQPVSFTELLKQPVAGLVPAAQYGTVVEQIVYPPNSFGRELKAPNLGNPSPVYHFIYEGGTPPATSADVLIRGPIPITSSGFGLINALTF